MTDSDLPSHRAVADELSLLGVAAEPAEVHGALSGFLCGGGRVQDHWLAQLELEAERAPAPDGALAALRAASVAQLEDPQFGFVLLLPDERDALDRRAEALLGWCRGFLGGFGLAAPSPDLLSEDAREALDDLGRIAGSRLSYEDAEGDEGALQEVTEFVRVAALLLHGDCVLGPQHRRRLN
ncbi:UPF0149 family protein [Coralloluteibacterium thermophilus]|uniref:UPF0149 family protein n=1 Tax=Coralloluteibacterium thermophilum TaxID=2707049 RepID=A0ABV9NLB9_9GAMM